MATPRQDFSSGTVTTRVVKRNAASAGGDAAPGGAAAAPVEALKRVYSGITITRDHLAIVLGCLRDCCQRVDIHANTFQLTDLDQLEAVIAEDKIIECLRLTAVDPHDGEMSLQMQMGYVEVEASNLSWTAAFRIIVRLLDGIPKNGTTMCSIATAPPVDTPAGVVLPGSARGASSPTALAVAAMTAAASPASSRRTCIPRSIDGGDPAVGRSDVPIAAGAAAGSPPSSLAGSEREAQSPAPGPGISAASGSAVGSALRRQAPLLLHCLGDLALLACVAITWQRLGYRMDVSTAILIGIAVLCIGGACLWTMARAHRNAPGS